MEKLMTKKEFDETLEEIKEWIFEDLEYKHYNSQYDYYKREYSATDLWMILDEHYLISKSDVFWVELLKHVKDNMFKRHIDTDSAEYQLNM